MTSRSLSLVMLVSLPLAFGAACDSKTKCQPTCAEPAPGGASGAAAAGQAGFAGSAGIGGDSSSIGGAAGADAAGGVGGAAASCRPPASTKCVQPAPSFATTITPILDRSCNTCHAADNPDGVWPLQAWADVSAWSDLIIPDLVNCTMPPADSNTPFPESDRQLLFAWLACGSPDN